LDEILVRIKPNAKRDIHYYIEKSRKKNQLFTLYIGKDDFIVVANHTIFDGVNCWLVLSKIFRDVPLWFPKFSYIPVYSELQMLNGIQHAKVFPKKNLRFDHYREDPDYSHPRVNSMYEKLSLNKVKLLKKAADASFVATMAAVVSMGVFYAHPTVEKLNIALTVAFHSKNRFNNFGVIIVQATRTKDIFAMIKDINTQFLERKAMAISTYVYSNIWNCSLGIASNDIILSSIPATKDKLRIEDQLLRKTQVVLPCSSVPLYICCLSDKDFIEASICNRCPDIQLEDLRRGLSPWKCSKK
jgi:hypothetical protein